MQHGYTMHVGLYYGTGLYYGLDYTMDKVILWTGLYYGQGYILWQLNY